MKITKDGKREYCCPDMSDFCGTVKINTVLANQASPLNVAFQIHSMNYETVFFFCPFCGDKIDIEKDDE